MAKKHKEYKQCILKQNGFTDVAWIETRGAKEGNIVEVIDVGFWNVHKVFNHILTEDELKIQHNKTRLGFASTKKKK